MRFREFQTLKSFRDERALEDAILLIRNPYDAILAEFNR